MISSWLWNWTVVCGHGEQFQPWNQHDFGHCFEQVAILSPIYVLLAIISAYHYGRRRTNLRGTKIYVNWTWFLILRILAVLMLLVIPAIQIVITLLVEHIRPSISDSLVAGLCFVGWLFHALYVWNVRYLHTNSLRGPLSAILIMLIVIAGNAIHLYTVIKRRSSHSVHGSDVEEIATIISSCLCFIYLISIIPNRQRIYHTNTGLLQPINSSETFRNDGDSFYQARDYPLGFICAEQNVGCLSWLSFHWVSQLMAKGAAKKIDSVDDLFLLPQRLNTKKLESGFYSVFHSLQSVNPLYAQHRLPNLNRIEDDTINTHSTLPSVEFISPANHGIQADNTLIHGYQSLSDEESDGTYTTETNWSPINLYETSNESDTNKNIGLLKALISTYGKEYFSLGILKFLADCFGFAGPIILNLLVTFVESNSEELYKGYLFACALFTSTLFGALCSTQFSYNVQVVAYKVRCALVTTVYRKSLRVNTAAQATFTPGEIVNFMSTDVDRILNFCPSFHAFWSLPFQVAVSLFLLYQQVGLAFLAGVAFAVLLVPINRKIAVKIGELSQELMRYKDERVKLMNELLHGIRVIKFYAWEQHFVDCIDASRKAELKCLKGRKYLDALCVFFWATTPVMISILTFTTYVLLGYQLTAAKVFTSLSLFLMLIGPLNAFPWVINGLVEAWVSLKRVEQFVNLDDSHKQYSDTSDGEDCVIEVREASFTWRQSNVQQCSQEIPANEATPLIGIERQQSENDSNSQDSIAQSMGLQDIDFQVSQGQLVGIIGKVGSGKSSLLSALLGDMNLVKGSIFMSAKHQKEGFAYVAQEPWIQNASIRDNILFGLAFNGSRYDQVVEACALVDDLKMMPSGDRTEVGENGITLSGGQKARLCLARAVYQDKSIYLLDDPYSAVDSHVAQKIHSHCIMGLLKHKIRIICTHHHKFLSAANLVLVMEDGRIAESGPPVEVLSSVHLTQENPLRERTPEAALGETSSREDEKDEEDSVDDLVEEEDRETGVVKAGVYKAYWFAVGACLAPWVFVSLFFMQASRNVSDWWLAYWVSHTKKPNLHNSTATFYETMFHSENVFSLSASNNTPKDDQLNFYLGIYGGLAGANSLFTLFRAFLFAYGGICAAKVVHQRLLSAVLRAPMSFFDSTPIGRILNRFSSDLYCVDDSLPFILNIFLAQAFGILGTLVVTCYGLPWFLLCIVPLGAIYYRIQHYYRHTSRELKRLSSVTLSPIYAHFTETVTGLSTIRAMRHSERFCEENCKRLDVNQRAQYATQLSARWLDFRLSMLGVAMVGCISFIAVLQHQLTTVDAGLVGLAISYSLSVTNLLSGVVMSFTETEKEFVSMERCQHYITETPSERWEGAFFPPTLWPSEGVIEFDNVFLKYRQTLVYALSGVSFKTCPGEKVGVVGRTGAGKSSMFLSLFRLVEVAEGRILVDDVDISRLDLKDIRSKFAIIPQDPFLFSGTVRQNLDPTSVHEDDELWSTLDRCHMRLCIERMGGLEATVSHRGKEFSVGQRQLICLGRAMLTKAKILCIDEATASIDLKTDGLIQSTIRHEFRNSTVLTIAHRINTVMDSHRVLVLKDGTIAEFAPPSELLANSGSLFYSMVYGAR